MLRSRIGSRLISGGLQALIAGAALAGPLASPAAAQTPRSVRVVSRSASIHVAARPRSEVLMTALRCAVFEVMDKELNWYWIYLPRDTYGVRRPGWVSALDVEITTDEPCKDLPTEIAENAAKQADASTREGQPEPAPSRSLIKAQDELEQARREFEKLSGVPSPESSSPARPEKSAAPAAKKAEPNEPPKARPSSASR
jgi:hypothetical protein